MVSITIKYYNIIL